MPGTVTIQFIPGSAESFADFSYLTSKDRNAAIEHFKTVAPIHTITIKPTIYYEEELQPQQSNTNSRSSRITQKRHFPIDQLI